MRHRTLLLVTVGKERRGRGGQGSASSYPLTPVHRLHPSPLLCGQEFTYRWRERGVKRRSAQPAWASGGRRGDERKTAKWSAPARRYSRRAQQRQRERERAATGLPPPAGSIDQLYKYSREGIDMRKKWRRGRGVWGARESERRWGKKTTDYTPTSSRRGKEAKPKKGRTTTMGRGCGKTWAVSCFSSCCLLIAQPGPSPHFGRVRRALELY